ncbi:efflux RND transporter periplasmic adaptor subunit [Achromobacter deleyi]|uniref:efflux RND transporter periplasmic adaptor subunit n=1 Tax=Achromobacter deleyi TaxID=1353891 RepID=UPI0014918AFD|nr:efflux RND transporter periplasmic adaptor subunit [Achromobacter deleyi]QVQ27072.1 efflux RND transporter periplasmic adaptor subunit [Achromobacter deleyi]UIP22657.1 efflux RND transporter periplasmic adaptor subunit [Achromobacter deleyi]
MTQVSNNARRALMLAIGTLTLALAACGERNDASAVVVPPMKVIVATIGRQPVDLNVDLPGRIEPIRTAEVRARVDGIVEKLLYNEGSDVQAGDPLFQIDPSDYKAQLAQANAMLQRAQAVQKNARSVTERFRPLVQRQAVSAQEYEAALAALGQAQANVSDAQAAVTLAQLRLDRCTVRAPIAGRVGRALVTEGALVSASAATLLAQVNQLSPISATFTKSNTAIMDLTDYARSGSLATSEANTFQVRLTLANGREFGETGVVDFADLSVDRSTGAQTIRARFDNAARELLPGQFVTGQIHIGVRQEGILIPARAARLNGDTATVFVIGPDDTAEARQIEVGDQIAGNWVVRRGLEAGDRIVVDGWHKIRPGQRVAPVEQQNEKP